MLIDIPLSVSFLKDGLMAAFPYIDKNKVPKEYSDNLDRLFKNGAVVVDRERLNIILTAWRLPAAGKKFFAYYFGTKITTVGQLQNGLEKFVKDALWHFGDLERAYLELSEEDNLDELFTRHKFHKEEFTSRLNWDVIEDIVPEDRGYLGYVSGQRPNKEVRLLSAAQLVVAELEANRAEYEKLPPEESTRTILAKLAERDPDIRTKVEEVKRIEKMRSIDLFSARELEVNKAAISSKLIEVETEIEKVKLLKKIGWQNLQNYLRNLQSMDVYVATSMRDDKEYMEMYEFIRGVFSDEKIKELNLRYFDPTLAFCDSRIDKGLVESLMVRSSKVTIYCAQEVDTFGKDSELASTLAHGKPAIVYVPKVQGNTKLEQRANVFREFHPLGLQIGINDGVARGVIVVRSPEQCAKVLYQILTNTLDVKISFEQHGIVLRERETNSIVRVATGWGQLASSFWHNFDRTKSPKSGVPFHESP